MSSNYIAQVEAFVAVLETQSAPEAVAIVNTGKAFAEAMKAGGPALAVALVDLMLKEVPFGAALTPLLNPFVSGVATLGEDEAFKIIDAYMAKNSVTVTAVVSATQ